MLATAIPIVTCMKNNKIYTISSSPIQYNSQDNWNEIQKLTAIDGTTYDRFGYSVSINGDTALIGEFGDDEYKGSAYVFTRTENTWTQQTKLIAIDGKADDFFGGSVSIDGDKALIGAESDDEYKGSVYVFIKNNQPPDKPTITGRVNGKPNTEYEYTFVSTDPEEDEISYYIIWGDNTNTGWTRTIPSGQYYNSSHNWSERGSYTIKAKARDINGAESDWTTLIVSIPKIHFYNPIIQLLMRMLECFLFFEKILNLN